MILLNHYISPELLRRANDQLAEFIDAEIDILEKDDDEQLLLYFFERIVYENPKRCRYILRELSQWAKDDWKHYLGPLHEYALYNVLQSADDDWDSDDERKEKSLVYGEESTDIYSSEDEEDIRISMYFELNIENPKLYLDECFEDLDFTFIEETLREMYEADLLFKYKISDDVLYFLPSDIRREYLNKMKYHHFDHLIDDMLRFMKKSFIHNCADQLLLNDDKTLRNESISHILIETILNPFCTVNDLDISREVAAGGGFLDFKISRGNSAVILEIKKYEGAILPIENALNYQLPAYMEAQSISSGILVVLAFCEDDGKLIDLCKQFRRYSNKGVSLEVIALYGQRIPPSKLRGISMSHKPK